MENTEKEILVDAIQTAVEAERKAIIYLRLAVLEGAVLAGVMLWLIVHF